MKSLEFESKGPVYAKLISKPLNEELFNARDVKEIISLPPRLIAGVDKLIWQWEGRGAYFMRNVYHYATEKLESNADLFVAGDWSKLWSMQVPFKVHQFAWRLAHNSLPTRINL